MEVLVMKHFYAEVLKAQDKMFNLLTTDGLDELRNNKNRTKEQEIEFITLLHNRKPREEISTKLHELQKLLLLQEGH